MSEWTCAPELPANLWSAMGMERKVLRIARRHFFPDDSDCEEPELGPSTSYKLDQASREPVGRGRGGRSGRGSARANHVRSSAMSASRKEHCVFVDNSSVDLDAANAFAAFDWAGTYLCPPDSGAMEPLAFDSSEFLQPALPPVSLECLNHVERGKRSSRRKSRPDFAALLSVIDGGIQASNEAWLSAAASAAAAAAAAGVDVAPELVVPCPEVDRGTAQPVHACASGGFLEVAVKKVTWETECCILAEEKGVGLPASTSHSASSSQGGFALEHSLSSPERISSRGWSPECSDDLN